MLYWEGFYSVAKSFEDDSDEEEVKREISKFELGEAISIKDDGGNELYNLLINSILLSDERNQFHENEPAQVIEIDYTYENISREDELYISESNFKVIDEGVALLLQLTRIHLKNILKAYRLVLIVKRKCFWFRE